MLAMAGQVGRFGGFTLDARTGEGRVSPGVDQLIGMPPDANPTLRTGSSAS
ncbi:hypothetical protein BH10ACT10_BH10ACT10_11690 [soil metagenome]